MTQFVPCYISPFLGGVIIYTRVFVATGIDKVRDVLWRTCEVLRRAARRLELRRFLESQVWKGHASRWRLPLLGALECVGFAGHLLSPEM